MRIETASARVAAGLIALLAWIGLAVQFVAVTAQVGSVTEAVWVMLRYFTVLTNLLAALVLTGLAVGQSACRSPRLLGLLTLSILFVGVVYAVLLRGLLELSGGALFADTVMHYVVPSLVPVFWLLFAPKGALRWHDPVIWAVYPVAYFVYALARGASDGKYPYPFMDIPVVGLPSALATVAIILILYLAAGLLLVGLGRWMGRSGGVS
ncbi:Pr6Pr family membrane protein [Brevundimonas subvibrioides]|uniref:FAR-17a/AIG1-like protein n=1 Tax=Brevundimonas subvibrioides (strain ATCC 15264 / DSM 4735 / LMG 14903 / NBRC 16000 / CB 81) TaxID=633149 RepID=D9QHD2_BRESC|nr:Pr6Pr family membrane protein [Brevundimonas subvibrioides]ADL01098.1 conserved hypothetical protein [Brevundimonas subvibrioides ATCC 15264]